MKKEAIQLERVFAPLPETERGKPFILRADPKCEKLIYGVANSVVLRSLEDPGKGEIITHHAKKVTSAAYAPSGYYICSGDQVGNVKIWDTVNEEHMVKYEYRPLSATVCDISWSDDSKRILAVGEGREKFAYVFSWDTGTSLGNIIGHNKNILSCDFKKTRPFGVVTASEDQTIMQFKGPPFKYEKTLSDHKNFVNCIRYNDDGSLVASAGMDGKIFIFDGPTMVKKHELMVDGKSAHAGGVYSISWSNDKKSLLSASADKTCKIWNAVDGTLEKVFTMGSGISDQQLGCLWVKDHLISLSLSGKISFLDINDTTKPLKQFWGHNKGIITMAISEDRKTIYTGSFDGVLNRWDVTTGNCCPISGTGFNTQITSIDVCGNKLVGVGIEDCVKFVDLESNSFNMIRIGTPSQPKCVCLVSESLAIVACTGHLLLVDNKNKLSVVTSKEEFSAVDINTDKTTIVAGGTDKNIYFYKLEGNNLVEDNSKKPLTLLEPISYLKFSLDGAHLAVGTVNRTVVVFSSSTWQKVQEWNGHDNRINCVSWASNNHNLLTCGIDGNLNVWDVQDRFHRVELRGAHKSYNITSVVWLDENQFVSSGQQDCALKFWKVVDVPE